MKKVFYVICLIIPFYFAFISTASAMVVYSNDFEMGIPDLGGWTWVDNSNPNYHITVVDSPNGERYLGRHITADQGFVTDQVTLNLENLTPHTSIKVSFDLYIMGHWEGNGRTTNGHYGPDKWAFNVNTPPTLFATFSTKNDFFQSFPQAYTGWDTLANRNPSEAGSNEDRKDDLGYAFDTVYEIEHTLTHTASSLIIYFEGDLVDGNGKWGLDNVIVEIDPVPIPGAVWLLGSGLIGLVGLRRKFRKA